MIKLILFITAAGIFAGDRPHNGENTVTAAVQKQNNYYVFAHCTPTANYKTIGTIKANQVTWNGNNCFCDATLPEQIEALTKQALKKFDTTANGIIYNGGSSAEIIKLQQ